MNPDNANPTGNAPPPSEEFLALADAIYEERKRSDPFRLAQCERALEQELRHAPRSY